MKVAFVRLTHAMGGSLMPGTRYLKLLGGPSKSDGKECISIEVARDLGLVLFRRHANDPLIGVPVLACDFIEFVEAEPMVQHQLKDGTQPHAQRRS